MAMDDEEGVDEDTVDEFVDPWGIINMPIRVRINKVIIYIEILKINILFRSVV